MLQIYPTTGFTLGTKTDRQNAMGAIDKVDVYNTLSHGADPGLAIQKAFDAFELADEAGTSSGHAS